MLAYITVGATTDHGGMIEEGLSSRRIHGMPIHLEGMRHFCPKCKCWSIAIGSNPTKKAMGKTKILEGDRATCGARFIAYQHTSKASGGAIVVAEPEKISTAESGYTTQFVLLDSDKKPQQGVDYIAFFENGDVVAGVTDAEGKTQLFQTDEPENIAIHMIDEFLSGLEITQI